MRSTEVEGSASNVSIVPRLRACGATLGMTQAKGVLVDRDGTIIVNVPYNGDPALVQPFAGAKAALDRLRAARIKVGVLTNQSGVGRGMITDAQLRAVNARVEELLGPFDGWFICPHQPDDACACRKPKPKLILDAAHAWGFNASQIVVVGDNVTDVEAARNAGAPAIKIDGACDITSAVETILRER